MLWELAYVLLLGSHVFAGVIALGAGFGAIITGKGSPRHNFAGRLYVLSMGFVVVSAVPLAIGIESWFLLAIAIFSGYLVFAGFRAVQQRRSAGPTPAPVDWLGHGTMLVVGTGMLVAGGFQSLGDSPGLGPALAVFGAIGVGLAIQAVRDLNRQPAARTQWWRQHIPFMGGAYIATVTATITVNLTMIPPLVRWLGPTIIGVPLIVLAMRRYKTQFAQPSDTTGAVASE